MNFAPLSILLFLALTAYAQMQERVAIINTLDDSESVSISDGAYLTDRLREIAADVLPKSLYGIMTTESIVAFFESMERAVKECNESSCLAELGRKVNADYVAQGRIRKFGELLSINFELYNTRSGVLVGSFNGNSKDVQGFVAIIDEKAPALFMKIENLKIHPINVISEPSGAILSFNGESSASCPQTPCKTELREGSVNIIAALEQYERADTNVFITAGSQVISMRLKPKPNIYGYCVFISDKICLKGPLTSCSTGGTLSNSCPYSSSSAVPSSSSAPTQSGIIKGTPVYYEGETYLTVVIGTQTWMASNLNYDAPGSKCNNCATYGRLYDWATAMGCNSTSCSGQIKTKHQGICPDGWHIPSNADWNVLMKTVNPSCSDNSYCAGAGTKLKAREGWNSYSGVPAGTDDFGFSALPGGLGYSNGSFGNVGYGGFWWVVPASAIAPSPTSGVWARMWTTSTSISSSCSLFVVSKTRA